MIAQRQHIRPSVQDGARMGAGQPHAARRVLGIDHGKVGLEPLLERAEPFGDGVAAGPPHDVAEKEDTHGLPVTLPHARLNPSGAAADGGIDTAHERP